MTVTTQTAVPVEGIVVYCVLDWCVSKSIVEFHYNCSNSNSNTAIKCEHMYSARSHHGFTNYGTPTLKFRHR